MSSTLFPYYTSFQSKDTTEIVLSWMLGSGGKSIHMKLGVMAGGVVTPKYLRFCPECFKLDADILGEAYWHRMHQIPGVIVCPHHGCILLNSKVQYSGQRSNEFFACNLATCYHTENNICLNTTELDLVKGIAGDTKWIIENYEVVRQKYENEGDLRRLYLFWLREKGLTTDSNRLYIEPLINSFRAYYGTNILELLESNVRIENANNWLVSIARKHRKAFHPLRHILIMKFLCGSVKNFFENTNSFQSNTYFSKSKMGKSDCLLKIKYRDIWLKECRKHPDSFKTDIRKLVPGVYIWLYRHDRVWLNANSPVKAREKNKDRIDWAQRDAIVLEEVKQSVRALINTDERPIRVTASTIGKRINRLALIEKHLDKMPKTKDYINQSIESVHEYRIRKIQWAICKLESEGKEVKAWVVLKMAGIRDEMWPQYFIHVDL